MMLTRGKQPSAMDCLMIEKAPEIMACRSMPHKLSDADMTWKSSFRTGLLDRKCIALETRKQRKAQFLS